MFANSASVSAMWFRAPSVHGSYSVMSSENHGRPATVLANSVSLDAMLPTPSRAIDSLAAVTPSATHGIRASVSARLGSRIHTAVIASAAVEWNVSGGFSNHEMRLDSCEAAISRAGGVGVLVGGIGVAVGTGDGVDVGGIGVAVGDGVLVGGTGVAVGDGVLVGGIGVAVGVGVLVGGTGVAVGDGVLVGGTGVAVGDGVLVGGTGVAVGDGVLVGGTGVAVPVGHGVALGWGAATAARGGSVGVAVGVGETGASPQAIAATTTSPANMHAQSADERLEALLPRMITSYL